MALALWAFWWEPSSIRVREVPLAVPGWQRPVRIAVLSDLHIGSPYQDIPKLRRIVELTNATRPDLIVIPGDLVPGHEAGHVPIPPAEFTPVLAQLQAPLGVYAVLGNHDWWTIPNDIRVSLEAAGIPVMDNRALRIENKGGALWLAGLGDANEGFPDIAAALKAVPSGAPLLLITHNPDIFPHVPAAVSLTIAGHTHGGQVYLPFIGRPIVPSRYGQRYAIGHIVENGRHLYVSPGIGTSILPVRFRVPPEITVLAIQ